jgi:hypothetical protein
VALDSLAAPQEASPGATGRQFICEEITRSETGTLDSVTVVSQASDSALVSVVLTDSSGTTSTTELPLVRESGSWKLDVTQLLGIILSFSTRQ